MTQLVTAIRRVLRVVPKTATAELRDYSSPGKHAIARDHPAARAALSPTGDATRRR